MNLDKTQKISICKQHVKNHYVNTIHYYLKKSPVISTCHDGTVHYSDEKSGKYIRIMSDIFINEIKTKPIDVSVECSIENIIAKYAHNAMLPIILGLLPDLHNLNSVTPSTRQTLKLVGNSLSSGIKCVNALMMCSNYEHLIEFTEIDDKKSKKLQKLYDESWSKYLKLSEKHDEMCVAALAHAKFGLKPIETIKHYVYVITDGEYCKIGYTRNIKLRLKQLQIGNPKKLTIVDYISTSKDLATTKESFAHKKLHKNHLRGEWFDVSPEIAIKAIR